RVPWPQVIHLRPGPHDIIRSISMPKSLKALALAVVVIAAFSLACSGTSRRGPSKYSQRLVILGFDGMDPHLLKRWMDEGKMPNISKLAKGGGMYPLQTTHS